MKEAKGENKASGETEGKRTDRRERKTTTRDGTSRFTKQTPPKSNHVLDTNKPQGETQSDIQPIKLPAALNSVLEQKKDLSTPGSFPLLEVTPG